MTPRVGGGGGGGGGAVPEGVGAGAAVGPVVHRQRGIPGQDVVRPLAMLDKVKPPGKDESTTSQR